MNKKLLARAEARKKKFKLYQKNIEIDSDESLSSDDECEFSDILVGMFLNNQYLIIKYIGKGTFSRVWLSYDTHNNKFVALKIYNDNGDHYNELRIMKIILFHTLSHPNIIKYYDFFVDNGISVLVLELCGQTLNKFINKNPSIEEMKVIMRNILEGINHFHQEGIIHTDLKADNFLTNQIPKEIQDTIDWFNNQINYPQLINDTLEKSLEIYYQNMSPDDKQKLNSIKKKHIRKKIKTKVIKQVINSIVPTIRQYIEEFSQDIFNFENNQINENNQITNNDNIDTEEIKLEELNIDEQPKTTLNEFNHKHIPIEDLKNLRIIITDFGNASTIEDENLDIIQCRPYRPPENILGYRYDKSSDIWSIGCIFYEFLTNHELFHIERDIKDKDQFHIALMYSILGKMNKEYAIESENSNNIFDNKGRVKNNKNIESTSIEQLIKKYRSDLNDFQINEFSRFLKRMLVYIPNERATAQELLSDSFLA
jgi:serine/threonine-protein kinase SRPK3